MLTINNPNFSEMLEEEFGAGVHIEPSLPWYGDQFADTFLKSKLWKTMFNLGFWYKPNLGVDSRIIRVGFVTSNQPECTIRNNMIDILRILSAQMHDCEILLIPYSKEIQFLFSTDSKVDIDMDRIVENAIGTLTPQQQEYYRKVLGYPQQLKVPVHKEIPCEANAWMDMEMMRVGTSDVTPSTSMDVNVMLQLANQYALTLDAIDAIPDGQPDKEKDVQTLVGLLENMEKAVPTGVPDCSKEVIQFIQKVGSYIKFSNTVKVEHRLGRIVSVAYALGMPFVKVEFVRTAIEQYRGEPVQVKYVPIWNNFNGATETVEIL